MKQALPNGIMLDDEEGAATTLNRHIASKNLSSLRAFVATMPDGEKNYLLVDGVEPILESSSSENIWCRIDIIAFLEKGKAGI
jgi:hypothetical protein